MKFCGECGKSLADPAAPVRSPDPRSYTPYHLAEKILTSRSALEGERKGATPDFPSLFGAERLRDRREAAAPAASERGFVAFARAGRSWPRTSEGKDGAMDRAAQIE